MQEAVTLSNGIFMPLIGFGTYKIHGREIINTVTKTALQAGYRSFDTAAVYRNEHDLGEALQKFMPEFGLAREDIFVTSKLSPRDQGREECKRAFSQSLAALKVDYLDLFLIHWPGAQKLKPEDPRNQVLRNESWASLEEIYKSGKVRAIGVSNYTVSHLKDLLRHSTVVPHVNQVEYHPYCLQKELKQFCQSQGIYLQAYSSLGTTVEKSPLLHDRTLTCVAKRLSHSPAQVLLRWATQQGIGVLPKSTNEKHIRENIQLNFCLSDEDLEALSNLNIKEKYAWDPSVVL
ncbi:glyoxal reductase [Procambarus clarkii]|uniref:glyoxal reductase n=1 Tax=Procambarus clarkii TaxID=6728 RepID=UPI001E6734AA|nr:glyoxal reductase-like isoform X1 [Procambarus clarkii]XP_045601508.1 glyoxal reductase-like isoform X1 [Procambarus clarkii]XP_045601516.1 glyoxal reductase-like isoform X1 [Procambarus clarkii]XP_045601524.1 glyoxal reductase-like isoform X1 [Procambarus clarkii]